MEKEIEEIIKKNLPAQVGDVLKTRLDQAEKDAIKLDSATKRIADLETIAQSLRGTIESYKSFDARNAALDARQSVVEQAERERKVFEAELKVEEAEKRCNEMSGFVGMVFKSPVFRKSISKSTSMHSYYSSNQNKHVDIPNEHIDENKTVD